MIIPILIIALSIIIMGLCVWFGYRRGTGKTIIRTLYLLVLAVISYVAAIFLAMPLTNPLLSILQKISMVNQLLEGANGTLLIIQFLVASLLSPLIFAILFEILSALSMIKFGWVSEKLVGLVKKDGDPMNKKSRWIGAGIGIIQGLIVVTILTMPLITYNNIIANTDPSTLAAIGFPGYEVEEAGTASLPNPSTALTATNAVLSHSNMSLTNMNFPSLLSPPNHSVSISPDALYAYSKEGMVDASYAALLMSKSSPGAKLTDQEQRDYEKRKLEARAEDQRTDNFNNRRESYKNSLASLIKSPDIILNAIGSTIINYNTSISQGLSKSEALISALNTYLEFLPESGALSIITSELVKKAANELMSEGNFLGISIENIKNSGAMANMAATTLLSNLARSTPDTIYSDLSGIVTSSAFVSIISGNVTADLLKSNETLEFFADSLISMGGSEDMESVMAEVGKAGKQLLQEVDISFLPAENSEAYEKLNEEAQKALASATTESDDYETRVLALADTIISVAGQYNYTIESGQAKIVAIALLSYFGDASNITVEGLMEYFGIETLPVTTPTP